jgi:hypothetical protein
MGWQIATNARIGFKLQVTATPGFHSLYDWCYQAIRLISGTHDNPEKETVMENLGADALYCAAKTLMHAIRTETRTLKRMPHTIRSKLQSTGR